MNGVGHRAATLGGWDEGPSLTSHPIVEKNIGPCAYSMARSLTGLTEPCSYLTSGGQF